MSKNEKMAPKNKEICRSKSKNVESILREWTARDFLPDLFSRREKFRGQ